MTYGQKLKDPRWQKRRLQVLEYAGWRCQLCGAKDRELHCHHSYYSRGKNPWQYAKGAIIALCVVCHDAFHRKKEGPAPARKTAVHTLPAPTYTPAETISRFAALRKLLEEQN